MKCIDCPHYTDGYMFNRCGVTGDEYYKADDNCTLVNEDGSLNYDNEFVKMEFGYDEKA